MDNLIYSPLLLLVLTVWLQLRRIRLLTKEITSTKDSCKVKSEFLANMSHEIRTPMNGVIGMTELLLDTDLTVDQKDLADTVKQSADSLLTIINDILDYSKIEAGKLDLSPTSFDLRQSLEGITNLLASKIADKNLNVIIHVNDDVPDRLLADSHRLRQVLLNLISNSIKFSNPHGAIILMVDLLCKKKDKMVLRFHVNDTGIGIAKSKQKTVFNSFTQENTSTTRNYGGTGLGLSISAQLVQLMGGQMTLDSIKNVGSHFSFTTEVLQGLPEEVTKEDKNSELVETKYKALDILLAEDNETNQKLATMLLEQAGHTVTLANDGKEAFELAKQKKFNIILMDIQMPILGGEEATKLILYNTKSINTETPIVALTANTMEGDSKRYKSQGMVEHISKPFRRLELLDVLERLAGNK